MWYFLAEWKYSFPDGSACEGEISAISLYIIKLWKGNSSCCGLCINLSINALCVSLSKTFPMARRSSCRSVSSMIQRVFFHILSSRVHQPSSFLLQTELEDCFNSQTKRERQRMTLLIYSVTVIIRTCCSKPTASVNSFILDNDSNGYSWCLFFFKCCVYVFTNVCVFWQ